MLADLFFPHPSLRQSAKTVADVDDDLRRLADDMRETMKLAKGIGLAAPQVGRHQRLIVMDADGFTATLANPQIIAAEGEFSMEEGCLSVPGVTGLVKRARCVTVSGLDMDGNTQTIDAEELPAVCLQHEIDHLDGVLFFDHLSVLKRMRLKNKYRKLKPELKAKEGLI